MELKQPLTPEEASKFADGRSVKVEAFKHPSGAVLIVVDGKPVQTFQSEDAMRS